MKLYEKSAGADASLLNGSTDIKKFGDLEGNWIVFSHKSWEISYQYGWFSLFPLVFGQPQVMAWKQRHEKQSMKARAWTPETKEWYMVSPCCWICWTWLQSFCTFALLRANRNRLNSRLSSPLQAWSWLQIRKKGVASNSILESLNALVDVTLGFRLAQSSSCEKKNKVLLSMLDARLRPQTMRLRI